MLDVHGEEVAGATFPVPIWHLYMEQAEKGRPVRQFQTPNAYPTFSYWHKNYYGYLAIQTTPVYTTTATTTTTAATTTTAKAVPARSASPAPVAHPAPGLAGARILP